MVMSKSQRLPPVSDNILVRVGSKLYKQLVGIVMGTNCALLVVGLVLFCYERDFI